MKATNVKELDEQYKNAREHTAVYEVDGVTYTVHSFYVGSRTSMRLWSVLRCSTL